jgi:hypothetical protein
MRGSPYYLTQPETPHDSKVLSAVLGSENSPKKAKTPTEGSGSGVPALGDGDGAPPGRVIDAKRRGLFRGSSGAGTDTVYPACSRLTHLFPGLGTSGKVPACCRISQGASKGGNHA